MSKSILVVSERNRHIHNISRKPDDINVHQNRLKFELEQKHAPALCGAIVDFLIADVKKDPETIVKVLAHSAEHLDDTWLMLLYESLFQAVTPLTPIPSSEWSMLTQDTKGCFDFIDKNDKTTIY